MRFCYLMISLLFLFVACSSNSGSKIGAAKASMNGQAANNDNPNKLGYDVFAALKENDFDKFKNSFLGAQYKDEMATMLTSVELTEQQKANTLGFLEQTVNYFSANNEAGMNSFFNNLKSDAYAKGIDWTTAEVSKINSSIVDIKDFGILMNTYKVDVEFKDKNDIDHMISIPRTYIIPSGLIAGDTKIAY